MKQENRDKTEDTIYGVNSEQQAKIFELLKFLKIVPRKRQNINFINVNVEIQYFDKKGEGK